MKLKGLEIDRGRSKDQRRPVGGTFYVATKALQRRIIIVERIELWHLSHTAGFPLSFPQAGTQANLGVIMNGSALKEQR